MDIARGYDGQDRTYLEALGTGATGKEPALYDRLRRELGVKNDPAQEIVVAAGTDGNLYLIRQARALKKK